MPLRPPVLTGLLVATLAAGLAGQAPTPGTGSGIIRGRVVRADTGQPLRKALISVNRGSLRQELVATTDSQGRYELKGLPAGRHVLYASKGGFVEQQYGQRRPGDSAQPLQLAAGQAIDGIDFALGPGSVLAGRVVDAAGEPLARVVVEALTPRYVQGTRELTASNARDVTDDLGQFRLFGVAPGRWVVRATSPDRPPDPVELTLRNTGTVTYYPGTHVAADAQIVQVDGGSERSGLTIAVVPERLGTIAGTMRMSDGDVPSGTSRVSAHLLRDGERMAGLSLVRPDGSFAIPNLPPGRYMVAGAAGGITAEEGAVTEVALDGASVSVALTLHKVSSARGRFTFDTDSRPSAALAPASVGINTEAIPPRVFGLDPLAISRPSPARDDWTFELPQLIGPRRLRVTAPEGWAVDSIRLDGKDIMDWPLDFAGKDIDGIVVQLTQRISAVRGQVSDQRGQKVTGATVVLFADDRARWTPGTRFVRAVKADEDGRFDVRGLPAARYMAVALEFLEPGEETNPRTLEQLHRLGTPITLDAGGTAAVDLKVSPAP